MAHKKLNNPAPTGAAARQTNLWWQAPAEVDELGNRKCELTSSTHANRDAGADFSAAHRAPKRPRSPTSSPSHSCCTPPPPSSPGSVGSLCSLSSSNDSAPISRPSAGIGLPAPCLAHLSTLQVSAPAGDCEGWLDPDGGGGWDSEASDDWGVCSSTQSESKDGDEEEERDGDKGEAAGDIDGLSGSWRALSLSSESGESDDEETWAAEAGYLVGDEDIAVGGVDDDVVAERVREQLMALVSYQQKHGSEHSLKKRRKEGLTEVNVAWAVGTLTLSLMRPGAYEPTIGGPLPRHLSLKASSFLTECSRADPREVPTVDELLSHPLLDPQWRGDAFENALLISDSVRFCPPPPRPSAVPALGGELFK